MATLISNSSGNFTGSSNWSLVDSTSYLNSEAGSTASTTSFVNSSQFTPGAITIDGIAVKVSTHTAVGTFSVRLVTGGGAAGTTTGSAVTGSTVTINTADIPIVNTAANNGWTFMKFAAPITLLAATAYNVQIQTSNAGTVTLYRDATASNWSRALRTTTNQAPAAADETLVMGDYSSAGVNNTYTVTFDNTTTTSFGNHEIASKGIVNWGTAASTNYYFKIAGPITVYTGGTYQMGTSGTPMPSTSTAKIEFACTVNVQYGFEIRTGATVNTFGNALSTDRAFLAADLAVAATSATTNISTAWKSGDRIAISSTSRTAGEAELVMLSADASGTSLSFSPVAASTISTNTIANPTVVTTTGNHNLINGQAVLISGSNSTPSLNGTQIVTVLNATQFTVPVNVTVGGTAGTVTPQLGFAHSGTSPTQAEVINVSRNVSIFGTATNLQAYVNIGAFATVNFQWTEFFQLGSATALKRGMDVATASPGSFTMRNCALRSFMVTSSLGVNFSSATGANITCSSNVFYNINNNIITMASTTVGTSYTVDSNLMIRSVAGVGISTAHIKNSVAITNNTATSCGSNGFTLGDGSATSNATVSGNIAHSNAAIGFALTNITNGTTGTPNLTMNSFTTWRNNTYGMALNNVFATNINGVNAFGNLTANFGMTGATVNNVVLNNLTSNAGTVLTCPIGFKMDGGSDVTDMWIDNSSFGVTTTHSTGDFATVAAANIYFKMILRNTTLASPTPVAGFSNLIAGSQLNIARLNGVAGNHKVIKKYGTTSIDTTIFNSGGTSTRLTPNNASNKLEGSIKKVAVPNGQTAKITVFLRKSVAGDGAAYNGNQPRLILKMDPSIGVTSDTVLATATNAFNGTWLALTATTPAITDNGVFQVLVDCDGTTGFINVDDWAVQ